MIIRKILYYSDLTLLFKIISTSTKISCLSLSGRDASALKLAMEKQGRPAAIENKERVIRYLNLWLWLRRKMGFKDSCFLRNILSCNILRQAGFDVQVNFGVKKSGERLIGHCWMPENESEGKGYEFVFSWPDKERLKENVEVG